jgi:uncharacterized coiled-coil protein SlyX
MTPTRATPETGVDSRAIHRTLTGLRDRLRLQEDELDRLRETIRLGLTGEPQAPAAAAPQAIEALEARIQQVEQIAAAKRPIPMPAPAIDQKALAEDVQAKVEKNLLPQVRALETQIDEQGKMLNEAFEVMGRTDMNVRRLIAQVDRLLEQLSNRPIEVTSEVADTPPPPPRQPLRPRPRERSQMFTAVEDLDEYDDTEAPRFRWKFPLTILVLLIAILAAVWYWYFRDAVPLMTAPPESSSLSLIDQARTYESDRNYPKAEAAYRELLSKDPTNAEVIRHLASVLYREDKVEESAEVMKKLPPDSSH